MKKECKYINVALGGALYGAFLILMSRCFIFCLGDIFYQCGKWIHLDQELLDQITLILRQLKTAEVNSPWIGVLVIAGIVGAVCYRIIHK